MDVHVITAEQRALLVEILDEYQDDLRERCGDQLTGEELQELTEYIDEVADLRAAPGL
jgi:DNA-binding MarR family transcriptional regulator